MLALVDEVASVTGAAVLMVTHDENVAACAKRRVVIKDGLVESDTTSP